MAQPGNGSATSARKARLPSELPGPAVGGGGGENPQQGRRQKKQIRKKGGCGEVYKGLPTNTQDKTDGSFAEVAFAYL